MTNVLQQNSGNNTGPPAESTFGVLHKTHPRALCAQSTLRALQNNHRGPYNIPQRGPWRFQHGWNVYVSVSSVHVYIDFVAFSLRSLNQKNLLGLLCVIIFAYSFLCLLFIGFFTQYGMWCGRVLLKCAVYIVLMPSYSTYVLVINYAHHNSEKFNPVC